MPEPVAALMTGVRRPALLASAGVAMLAVPVVELPRMLRFSWSTRPQDTLMPEWMAIADQVDIAFAVALVLCASSAMCFVLAGFRAGITRSWGLVLTGLMLAMTVSVLSLVVGIDALGLTRAWATVPM